MKYSSLSAMIALAFAVTVTGAQNETLSFAYDKSSGTLVVTHPGQGVVLSTTLAKGSAGELSGKELEMESLGAPQYGNVRQH